MESAPHWAVRIQRPPWAHLANSGQAAGQMAPDRCPQPLPHMGPPTHCQCPSCPWLRGPEDCLGYSDWGLLCWAGRLESISALSPATHKLSVRPEHSISIFATEVADFQIKQLFHPPYSGLLRWVCLPRLVCLQHWQSNPSRAVSLHVYQKICMFAIPQMKGDRGHVCRKAR